MTRKKDKVETAPQVNILFQGTWPNLYNNKKVEYRLLELIAANGGVDLSIEFYNDNKWERAPMDDQALIIGLYGWLKTKLS